MLQRKMTKTIARHRPVRFVIVPGGQKHLAGVVLRAREIDIYEREVHINREENNLSDHIAPSACFQSVRFHKGVNNM